MLLITNDNRIYLADDEKKQFNPTHGESLTDDQIIKICSDFVESNRLLALQNKLVATMTLSDEGHQLTFEPLALNLQGLNKIQGELPVEHFIRYGRHLVFSDFKAIVDRFSDDKKEN